MSEKYTQQEVEQRFRENGLELLDVYNGAQTRVSVRGLQCGHQWRVKPCSVRHHGPRCMKCYNEQRGEKCRLTQEEVILRLREKGVELIGSYLNRHSPVLVICIDCGCKWNARPGNIFRDHGCPDCGRIRTGNAKRLTESDLQKRLRELSERGIVMVSTYTVRRDLARFRCMSGHFWETKATNVFKGRGCPACAIPGFRFDKPGTLYYVKIQNSFGEPLYKIGITNKSLRERFRGEFSKMTIIETWHFENGAEAYEMEQDILKDYDADRWTGPDILETGGNDELFTLDVLGLDKGVGQLELVA